MLPLVHWLPTPHTVWGLLPRLLQLSKLTTSRTKQVCKASFKNGRSYQCVLRFWHSICLKKVKPRSVALVMHSHLSKPEDLMSPNATLLREKAPWPPNIFDEDVSCTAPAARNPPVQILFKCPTPAIVLETAAKPFMFCSCLAMLPKAFLAFWLRNVLRATAASRFWTSQRAPRPWSVLNYLNWKCVPRLNSVQFFMSHRGTWLQRPPL